MFGAQIEKVAQQAYAAEQRGEKPRAPRNARASFAAVVSAMKARIPVNNLSRMIGLPNRRLRPV